MIDIKIWEETDYVKSGDSVNMYFRSANSKSLTAQKYNDTDGTITDTWFEWNNGTADFTDVLTYNTWFEWNNGTADFTDVLTYNSLDEYANERYADPTRIWMYVIDANTILNDKTVAPKLETDPDTGAQYYTLSVSGNVDKTSDNYSVAEYEEQMMYMLKSQGQNPSEFYFTEIKLDVQVWPNGFLRQVVVTESYYMELMGFVDSVVTLTSTKAFFFDENDLPAADVDHGAFVVSQIGQVQAAAK